MELASDSLGSVNEHVAKNYHEANDKLERYTGYQTQSLQ